MTLWFLARAAGFVALLAATATVALGATGTGARGDSRIVAQLVHRSAAVLTLAMLGLHALLLIADRYVAVSLTGALVPFTAGYRGVALGLGTLAVYAFVVVALTGALRGRMAGSATGARSWRAVHLTAYLAWALAMTHGLLAGTDSHFTWARLVYVGCALAVGITVAIRLAGGARDRRAPIARARRAAGDRATVLTGGHR